jgi:hypothetical protein
MNCCDATLPFIEGLERQVMPELHGVGELPKYDSTCTMFRIILDNKPRKELYDMATLLSVLRHL